MVSEAVGRHLAAVVVPFASNLSVDDEALRAVCRHVLKVDGIDGVVVNAHAGEVDTLTAEERLHVLRIAGEEAHAAGKKVVSGVLPIPGSYPGAVSMAQSMQEAGADSLLLLGPPGFGRGVDAVPEVAGEYTQTVASSVGIPIVYFVAGALSGINYTPDVIRQICSVDNVVAVKDTAWSPQGFDLNKKTIRGLNRNVAVLSGNDNCLFYNFVSGADGTLLILHCVMAPAIVEMYDAVAANDLKRAHDIHEKYEGLVAKLFARPMLKMPTRAKFVLRLMGVVDNDRTRAPVPALASSEAADLEREVRALGLRW